MRLLLPRHRDAPAVLGLDHMVDSILSESDLNPVDFAAELGSAPSVIICHGRPRLEANIAGFVDGEENRLSSVNTALAAFVPST